MTDDALRVTALAKSYGGRPVLSDINLAVRHGEFVALLGPSGAGKTTLFRCLTGLTAPDRGEIRGARRGEAAFVFQQFNLVRRASALDNVLIGRLHATPVWRVLMRRFAEVDRQRALAALDVVGLLAVASQRADRLSGGQQQRVAIARVLAQGARILFADEPIASLDPTTARTVLQTLRDVAHRDGIAVVCSLHQAELASEFADRIIGMKLGRFVFDVSANDFGFSERHELYAASSSVGPPIAEVALEIATTNHRGRWLR